MPIYTKKTKKDTKRKKKVVLTPLHKGKKKVKVTKKRTGKTKTRTKTFSSKKYGHERK